MMSAVMICDPRGTPQDLERIASPLIQAGNDLGVFSDRARFLEAAIAHPPRLVVYALDAELEADLAVLRLLRRAHPHLGLIVLTGQPSLRTRTVVQTLRPIFYAVDPPDPEELVEVVRTALARRERPG
jgi:DNA-binding NarL/FixJ family response regulator